jgi:aminoglycoside 3-N-acetyltransferase I
MAAAVKHLSSLKISPMMVKIKVLNTTDIESFKELITLFSVEFEREHFNRATDEHLESLLSSPNFTVLTASRDHVITGGLTAYTIEQYYSNKPLAYIYDLAVKQEYQRSGIGKQLIRELLQLYKARGFEEVFVQAEKEDEGAVNFYYSTGALEKQVAHFYYPLT